MTTQFLDTLFSWRLSLYRLPRFAGLAQSMSSFFECCVSPDNRRAARLLIRPFLASRYLFSRSLFFRAEASKLLQQCASSLFESYCDGLKLGGFLLLFSETVKFPRFRRVSELRNMFKFSAYV